MKISEERLDLFTSILGKMKQEVEKRDVLYAHGVDLINYQNIYYDCLMDTFEFEKKGIKDEVEWWLYDSVEKKYWVKEVEYDVSDPKDFLKFIFSENI